MATASRITGKAAAKVVDGRDWILPNDAFVDILLRLPPITLWRCRLVSWHWRAVIDERTPWRSQPKPLAFCVNGAGTSATAYVFDNLADERHRMISRRGCKLAMVGTCNGLLCVFCDGGHIRLINPVTGEKLRVPPCPEYKPWRSSSKSFSFGFHLPTGLYKIVYLPYAGRFYELQVFTLGDASSWRRVAVPGESSCHPDAGLVSVAGYTFWVTQGADRVASFDLGDESVAHVPLPVEVGRDCYYNRCHLTEVHGRLGLAVSTFQNPAMATTEVWVLGEGRERHKWSRKYRVQMEGVEQQLARPHFAHGEYILTTDTRKGTQQVFGHRLLHKGRQLVNGEVQSVRIRDAGTPVAGIPTNSCLRGTFAFVETTEPLRVYKLHRRKSHTTKACARV
ncbi:hypothetical protein EJB05_48520, partial [Eragrostis curvula]